MRIVIRRSGGYAGEAQTAGVDTSRLDPARAREVEQLVQQTIADASERAEPIGADLTRYEITVEDEAGTRSLTFTDDGRPDGGAIKGLIEMLKGLS